MVMNPQRSKFDVVISNLASMEYMTTFTIQTFTDILASVGISICRSTLYNYMDYLFQAEQGVQKLKTRGEKRLYYQIIGDVPLDLSSTSLRKQAFKKHKERGWLKAVKINVTPTDEINYSDEKRKEVNDFYLKNPPRKRSVKGGGSKKGVAHKDSKFQAMYGILSNMKIGSVFGKNDLLSILLAVDVDMKKSALNNYMGNIFRADCGVDRIKVYGRWPVFYTITQELPTDVTISFFRKISEGVRRKTIPVQKTPVTSIEFKDPEMKKLWLLAKQRSELIQPEAVSEEKVESVAHPVVDQPYTEAELGQMLVSYLVELEARNVELEGVIREFKRVPDLREEVATLKGRVSGLETELEAKDEQLSELSSELEVTKRTRGMSLRQKVSQAVDKLKL